MFARLALYEDADLSLEEEALAWMSAEGLRIAGALPGYRGLLTLVDRDGRRLVGIGFYESAEDARQVDALLAQVPLEAIPEELRRALPTKSYVGVLEVIECDGVDVSSPHRKALETRAFP